LLASTSTQDDVLPDCWDPSVPVVTVNVFALAGSAKAANSAASAGAMAENDARRMRGRAVQTDFMKISPVVVL